MRSKEDFKKLVCEKCAVRRDEKKRKRKRYVGIAGTLAVCLVFCGSLIALLPMILSNKPINTNPTGETDGAAGGTVVALSISAQNAVGDFVEESFGEAITSEDKNIIAEMEVCIADILTFAGADLPQSESETLPETPQTVPSGVTTEKTGSPTAVRVYTITLEYGDGKTVTYKYKNGVFKTQDGESFEPDGECRARFETLIGLITK